MIRYFSKKILTLIFLVLPLGIFAQKIYQGDEAAARFPNAELVRDSQFSSLPSFIRFRESNQFDIDQYKKWMNDHFKFDPNIGFNLIRTESDELGHVHYRYQQTYFGKLIEDAIWIVHTNNDKVYALNGLIYEQIVTPTAASLSESAALEKAMESVGAETYKWQLSEEEEHLKIETGDSTASFFPKGELVFVSQNYSFDSQTFRLAYKFNIYAHQPVSRAEIYVDAVTGAIIRENEIIHHIDTPGTAHTVYSGDREIIADSFGGTYRLRDLSRGNGVRTYDMNTGTSYGSSVDFTDIDNDWNNINPQKDQYATDAHWGAEMTYDYFLDIHGRNSIDNAGFQLNNYVHYGVNYYNAFWDGSRMTFGDGPGGAITPLTSIDIAGHEVAHGLTTFTAGLIYYAESGALNESFSDIFGASIERFARPDDYNWLLGEDIGTHFRSMSNPNSKGHPDTYFGTYWASLVGGDSGGVHTNSGVQNFWFYLLTEGGTGTNDIGNAYSVSSRGIEASSAIAFRNLTVYLTSSSQYIDARFFSLQAAQDLYGGCSNEVEQTANAWYAVGVGGIYDPTTIASFSTLDTFGCALPFEANFTNSSFNGITYLWDFGDGTTSTEENPTHVYTTAGIYTVTLNADGGACGSDELVLASYIEVDTDAECIITLPPDGILGVQRGCDGTIYDSGGPIANYGAGENSQVTIDPLGAVSVNLDFITFSVEAGPGLTCNYDDLSIYDGPSIFSPLIGKYCNNNLPSDMTSSGSAITLAFHSDGGLELSGFNIEWSCNPPDDVPETDFIVNSEITCSGLAYFTDLSTNIPIAWAWDFGDGGTSTLQHPVHEYLTEGTYTVTLVATNLVGDNTEIKTDYVTVAFPETPTVVGDTNCVDQTATLVAAGEGTLKWYTEAAGGVPFFEGDTLTTLPLAITTTYYVEDDLYDSPEFVGPVDNTFGTGGYFSGDQFLVFNNPSPVFLKSVDVYAGSAGSRTIELRNNLGGVIETMTVDVPVGESTVVLDFEVPIGEALQLGTAIGSSPNLYRNDAGAAYPYLLAESIEIVGSSTGPEFYYFFYNWEIHPFNCASDRIPVTAEVEYDSDITIEAVDDVCLEGESLILSPSEPGGTWSSDCGLCIDELTGAFDPAVSGVGTWEIFYTVPHTCSYLNSLFVNVIESTITIDPVADICSLADPIVLTASEIGGTWTATCGACIDEVTGEFNPTTAGIGSWEIVYTVAGTCSEYNPITINVIESDIVIYPIDHLCQQGDPVILTASEPGGTWSASCGACIDPVTGEFNPALAGIGEWTITYDVDGTCSSYNTSIVYVVDCLGLPNEDQFNVTLYPNPNNGLVNVNMGGISEGDIIIKDVLGKTVLVYHFTNSLFSVDLKNSHADGTYFIEFYANAGQLIGVKKIVKQ